MDSRLTYSKIPVEARTELTATVRRESIYRIFTFVAVFGALLASSLLANWRTPRSANYSVYLAVRIGSGLLIVLAVSYGLIEPWLRREVLRRFNPNKAQEPTL